MAIVSNSEASIELIELRHKAVIWNNDGTVYWLGGIYNIYVILPQWVNSLSDTYMSVN